jgi:type I restriction enzyme S subunit
MNETLEAMARALFKSWFVDFDPVRAKAEGRARQDGARIGQPRKPLDVASDLPWPGAEAGGGAEGDPGQWQWPQHILDLFPARLVDSELGEIPEGWEVGKLGDVAEHPRRSVQPATIEPDVPYIALEHMPKRCIALSDWGIAEGLESNKFEFKKGEILFGKLRPYFHKVGVAPVDGVCSTDIVVLAPREPHWFTFVLGLVSSDEFVEFTNAGSTGTKMPRTSWADMTRYELVKPPRPIAKAFTDLLRPSVERIIASLHDSRNLAALRDALLPKLISGELRVNRAERFVAEGL